MVFTFSHTGRVESGLRDVNLVVAPRVDGSQSLFIEGATASAQSQVCIVPVLAPAEAVKVKLGRFVAEFVDVCLKSFPDARVPSGHAKGREEEAAAHAARDVLGVVPASPGLVRRDEESHHHAHSALYASAYRVVAAEALGAALRPTEEVAALAAAYSGYSFVLIDIAESNTTVAVEIVSPSPSPSFLYVPTRTGLGMLSPLTSSPSGAGPSEPVLKWDAHILSIGTARTGDWSGGGKTPAEMLDDMKHRFASGTFKAIELPKHTWEEVRMSGYTPHSVRELFEAVRASGAGSHLASPRRPAAADAEMADGCEPGRTSSVSAAVHQHGASTTGGAGTEEPNGHGRSPRKLVSFTEGGSAAGPSSPASGGPLLRLMPALPVADVIRMKKIAFAVDLDLLLRLDDQSFDDSTAMTEE